MDFTEWNDTSLAIKIHVACAVLGMIFGAVVVAGRKGGATHRLIGRGFGIAALLTALTSFFIHEIQLWGIWSPIHLLSLYVLFSVFHGVTAIRRGNIDAHRKGMVTLYASGFVIAAGLTFLPGRLLFETFLMRSFAGWFPDNRALGETIALGIPFACTLLGIWLIWRELKRSKPPAISAVAARVSSKL